MSQLRRRVVATQQPIAGVQALHQHKNGKVSGTMQYLSLKSLLGIDQLMLAADTNVTASEN